MRCCSINVRIAIAVLGVLAGCLAAPCFLLRFHNVNATAWALISSLVAAVVLWVHVRQKRQTLAALCRENIQFLMLCGCFVQLAGVCSLSTYLSLAAILPNQDLQHLFGENFWIASVWSFMTWKWGFQLFWFSRMYKRELEAASLLKKRTDSIITDSAEE